MAKRTSLSLKKFFELLKKHSYTLVSIYCLPNGEVIFLEIRTPKVQKTFIVSVPNKYKMPSDTDFFRKITISPDTPDTRQVDYVLEIKGPLLTCDLISISSSSICLSKNNGDVFGYILGLKDESSEDDEDDEDEEDDDSIEKIIGNVKELAEQMDEHISDENEGNQEDEVNEEEVEEIVELVFEDADGNEIDGKVAEIMEADVKLPKSAIIKESEIVNPKKDSTKIKEKKTSEETTEKSDEKARVKSPDEESHIEKKILKQVDERRKDNSVPQNIEDDEVVLGIVYYCIDISHFYKKISEKGFESEILTVYDTLDDNEDETRSAKLDEIIELTTKLADKVKDEVLMYKKQEMKYKAQIIKLSSVLENSERLRIKADSTPEKYASAKPEIERVCKQTKTALHDINIQLSLGKDRMSELLEQYKSGLEELLDN